MLPVHRRNLPVPAEEGVEARVAHGQVHRLHRPVCVGFFWGGGLVDGRVGSCVCMCVFGGLGGGWGWSDPLTYISPDAYTPMHTNNQQQQPTHAPVEQLDRDEVVLVGVVPIDRVRSRGRGRQKGPTPKGAAPSIGRGGRAAAGGGSGVAPAGELLICCKCGEFVCEYTWWNGWLIDPKGGRMGCHITPTPTQDTKPITETHLLGRRHLLQLVQRRREHVAPVLRRRRLPPALQQGAFHLHHDWGRRCGGLFL